jgi:hypothetical protein
MFTLPIHVADVSGTRRLRRHLTVYGSANMYKPVSRSRASGGSGE